MALTISTYVDPGVYQGEVIGPGAGAPATQPMVTGIVGVGQRNKRTTNEAVRRGFVEAAALRMQAPHTGTGVTTDSITAPTNGIQTLTIAAAAFPDPTTDLSIIGATLTIRGAANGPNNGSFVIVGRPGATQLQYLNTLGVVEANFAGTYSVPARAEVESVAAGPAYTPVRADRRLSSSTLYRNAIALADSFLSFATATDLGAAGPFALATSTQVHAAVAGDLAGGPPTTFPGPITVPSPNVFGRDFRLSVDVAANWDGGDVIINATSAAGAVITLTWNAAAIIAAGVAAIGPTTIAGAGLANPVAAISTITKSLVGAAPTASVTLSALGETNAFGLEMDGHTPLTIALKDRRALYLDPFGSTGLTGAVAAADAVTGVAGVNIFPLRQPVAALAPRVWFSVGYNVSVVPGGTGAVTITGLDALGAIVSDVFTPVAGLPLGAAESVAGVGGQLFTTFTSVSLNIDGNVSAGSFAIGAAAAAAAQNVTSPQSGSTLPVFGSVVWGGMDLGVAAEIRTELAAVTRAEAAAGINTALVNATALGYGTAYTWAARDNGANLQMVSPLTPASATAWTSDVRVFPAFAASASTTLFGSASEDARCFIQVATTVWSAAATYTLDYVRFTSDSDTLGTSTTSVQSVARIGSLPGQGNFVESTDWRLVGTTTLDWSLDSAPALDSIAQGPGFGVSVNDSVVVSVDGKENVTVDLSQTMIGAEAVLPGFLPGLGTATAAQLAAVINAVVSADVNYGPRYRAIASTQTVSGATVLRLTSPTEGIGGSVSVSAPSAASAFPALYGTVTSPVSAVGSGSRPATGADYFVSYDQLRPSTDYAVQKRFFTRESAEGDIGVGGSTNPLATAVALAFDNGAPTVVTVQVRDWSDSAPATTYTPTRTQWRAALDAVGRTDTVTDVVALTTDLAVQTDLKDHIEAHSSPTRKRYRRGWFGLPAATAAGDRDTPSSFVYIATRTLQVAGDSVARGRLILVAPPQQAGVQRDVTLEDGSTQTLTLGSEYIAVAAAARQSALTSPAFSWTKRTVTGFTTSFITAAWADAERQTMSSQGVFVVTYDAGLFVIRDGVTTEGGGASRAAFLYPSCSSQKDNVTRKVDAALDSQLVGVVPTSLADFIIDIKLIVLDVVAGEIAAKAIAPFTSADGTTNRAPDISTDVAVRRDPNDPTRFYFKYAYNLRYAALRLLGEFSVDNPLAVTV